MYWHSRGQIAAIVSLAAGFALQAAGPQQDSPREAAAALARKARRAEKAGHPSEAFVLYSEAAAVDPGNQRLAARMKAVQARADEEAAKRRPPAQVNADTSEAADALPEQFDSIAARELALARPLEGPVSLAGRPGRQDFDLSANARGLFDQVAQRFGLSAIYDSSYPAAGTSIRFRVTGVNYAEALSELEAATGSFVTPISSHLFMVAQDTAIKRNELERTVSLMVPFPQATTAQELTEVVQVVRQALNVEKMAVDSVDNAIVIRDRISRAAPAQALLTQMFSWRPEVMLDVEFIEVADADIVNYGFNVTNTFQAVPLGTLLHNAITAPSGAANLLTFGGGKTLIGIGVATAQAMFNETESTGRTLFRAQLRSVDRQPATLHVGERYPVVTTGFAGGNTTGASATTTTSTYAPPPVFQYQDLGLQVKMTPHIHGMGDVTLELDTSYQLLTGESVNSIPVIGRRQLTTTVRLRDNEWAVVAGLMSPTESKAVSGFFGLANLPLVGNLFKQTTLQKQDSHILIAIKPHLLSLPPDQLDPQPLRVGTETRPFTPL